MTHRLLVRHVWYPVNQLRTGKRVLSKLAELERTQWLSPVEAREYQRRKLEAMLRHAKETVPYYAEAFAAAGVSDSDLSSADVLRRLPILTRDLVRMNAGRLVSSAMKPAEMVANSTGGSTGEVLRFFTDRVAADWREAMLFRNHAWAGAPLGEREACLWGAPFDIRQWEGIFPRMKARLRNYMMLSTFDLSPDTMRRYARLLQQFEPRLITGYPTPLSTFARFLAQEGLDTMRPVAVISSAETLFDEQRQVMESVFRAPVFNRYGSREFADVAHECSAHQGLHVNAERVVAEVLLPDGSPAAPGQPGELAITDLDNFGMPFIRYKPGDIAAPSDRRCPCGRGLPLLDRVEGRTLDMIVTPQGKMLGGTFWTLLVRTVPGVFRFQVVQTTPELVELRIVPDAAFTGEGKARLAATLKEHAPGLRVAIVTLDGIPLTGSGKFRVVVNEVPGIVTRALAGAAAQKKAP